MRACALVRRARQVTCPLLRLFNYNYPEGEGTAPLVQIGAPFGFTLQFDAAPPAPPCQEAGRECISLQEFLFNDWASARRRGRGGIRVQFPLGVPQACQRTGTGSFWGEFLLWRCSRASFER